MRRTRIKICGITRPEDALLAARLGADAIGLVFFRGARRCVTPGWARQIVETLPAFVTPIGLFVDASVDEVRATAREVGLHHVQLHGHETPAVVAALPELSIIKAVHVDPVTFKESLDTWRNAVANRTLMGLRGIVLETSGTGQAGGSGIANDWESVLHHHRLGDFVGLPPWIAAGGLRPETVGDVVHQLHPWAVDVSSGVEESMGIKSAEKIEAFVRAVRSADQ